MGRGAIAAAAYEKYLRETRPGLKKLWESGLMEEYKTMLELCKNKEDEHKFYAMEIDRLAKQIRQIRIGEKKDV